MKNYLLAFRDQVFNGSLLLYKRIFIPYLLLSLLVGIITAITFIPLILKFIGWDFADLLAVQSKMQEFNQNMSSGGNPADMFKELIKGYHFEYLVPVILLGLFITPWSFNLYYTLNDNEVRNGSNSILKALKQSFSGKILTLLAFILVYYLLIAFSFIIFIFIVAKLMSLAKILGILVGFFGIFFLIFFLFRFALGPSAIVHGNMTMSQAFGYSFTHITMKRSALLCLMGLVVLVVMGIISGISSTIVNAIISQSNVGANVYFIVNQIISNIFGALASAFIYAGSSALYFRYSADEVEDDPINHLMTND